MKTLKVARIAQVFLVLVALPWAGLYVILPLLASEIGKEMGVQHLVLPYALASCFTVLALHIFMLAVWKIVSFIRTTRFYSMPVQRWVKVAKISVICGCLLPVSVGLHLLIVENAGGPMVPLLVFGVTMLAVLASALLDLLVELYRDASLNVAELADVI